MSSRIVALRSIIPSVHVVKKSRSRPSQHIKADLTLCLPLHYLFKLAYYVPNERSRMEGHIGIVADIVEY